MDKKKAFLPTIALLITFIISISASALFSNNNKISKKEAYDKKRAEILVTALNYNDNIDDVIINTETNPKQVSIITKATHFFTPEAKDRIEKLISDVYPESTVTVNYLSD